MKRYKLKKDLPTFKAGEIFYLSDNVNLLRESDNIHAYSWSTIDKFPNILTDWFEEIKETTSWKPEKHDWCWYISACGALNDFNYNSSPEQQQYVAIGNCFQTKEEAERVIEYLKALAAVRGDKTSKFVEGNENWHVCYETRGNYFYPRCNFCDETNGIFGLPYFATEEDARRSIELHKNEWLTIFGVEEEK